MTELQKRKHPRLKSYDYSENGSYFVTICTDEHKQILSSIKVGRGLAPAEVVLSPLGKIVKEQIEAISLRYAFVEVQKYVIMPNHIHMLVFIDGFSAGASPRPTLSDIICSFKSLATRKCKKFYSAKNIWQTSFYDHIIRSERDYAEHYRYIEDNPTLWLLGKRNYYLENLANRNIHIT